MIGTITLSPSIDREMMIKELVKDDAVRALRVLDTAGGKGVNVSKVVYELGGKTTAFSFMGGFEGKLYASKIKTLGFPYHLIPITGETRLNVTLTDRDDATQTRISAPAPRVLAAEYALLRKRLERFQPRPLTWVFGGTLPAGSGDRTYYDLIQFLKTRTGSPCVLDTDGEALRLGIQAKPFLIKPNEFEIERLMGRSFGSVASYARAAEELVRQGVTIAIVSLGPQGALFVSRERSFFIPSVRVKVRSKVGAGDSLIAGVLLALERGWSFEKAALLGMAASHSAVMRESPRLCQRADIPRLLPRFKVRPLKIRGRG